MMQQLRSGIPDPEYPSEELRAGPLGYLEAEAEYRRAMDKRAALNSKRKHCHNSSSNRSANSKHNASNKRPRV